MQLLNIKVQNFLALRLLDLDLSQHSVHLFAGRNEAGKTSLQEAIRFALRGEAVRVDLKRDYSDMITDGAKSGSIKVRFYDGNEHNEQGYVERNVGNGKIIEQVGFSEHAESALLPLALDAHRFSSLTPADRRGLLLSVTGYKVKSEEVKKRLLAKDLNEEKIDMVLPMIRTGGFDAVHNETKERLRQSKADWKAITKETYGCNKAEDWAPALPAFSEAAYEGNQRNIEKLDKELSELNSKKGGVTANAEQNKNRRKELETRIAELNELSADKNNITDAKEAVEERVKEISARINHLKGELDIAAGQAEIQPCPDCGAALVVVDGKIEQDVVDAESIDVDQVNQLLADETKLLEQADEEYNDRFAALTVAAQAEGTAKELGGELAKLTASKSKDTTVIDNKISEIETKRQEAMNAKSVLEQAKRTHDEAEQKIKDASGHHLDALGWDALADALAPDGLPAEMLADAIKPINDRLRETAMASGWDQVVVTPNMAITVNGKGYGLLSESAKWRADAAVTETISLMSGMKLLILDRVDVLDIPNRQKLINWIDSIKPEYDTILMMGTFKQMPTGVSNDFGVYWMENGEIVEQRETKLAQAS